MALTSFRRHPEPVSEFSNVINSGELPGGLPAPLPAFPTSRLLLSTGSQSGSLVALESLDPDGSSNPSRVQTLPSLCGVLERTAVVFEEPGITAALPRPDQIHAPAFISQSLRPGCPRRTTALCWGGHEKGFRRRGPLRTGATSLTPAPSPRCSAAFWLFHSVLRWVLLRWVCVPPTPPPLLLLNLQKPTVQQLLYSR